jgi:predicted dehydrogenase
MAEAPLKIGIIGATGRGDYGHSLDVGAIQFGDGKVVAIADANAQGLQAAQKKLKVDKGYANYREMLEREKLDIAIIGPRWIDQHAEMLLAAAQAGCHVYMEKPFCRTLAECDQVLREFEMRHLHIAIAHTAFYSPVTERVLEAIAAGEIGEVLELRGRGKEDQRGGGEDLWVLGSHVLGLMSLVAMRPHARLLFSCKVNRSPQKMSLTAMRAWGSLRVIN